MILTSRGGAGSGVRRLPFLLIFIHPFNQDNLSYPVGKNDYWFGFTGPSCRVEGFLLY